MGRAQTTTVTAATAARETVLCPYCGVPLFSARDRADHLDSRACCLENRSWDCADLTDPHDRCCRTNTPTRRSTPRRAF
ncbi:hypothetical protein SAMN05877809_102498 [Rhodobacter sp. JA431]|uniref:hypothetical protein n=1 Tax=Rhodobacter sp. JA431 TaxID=570013 RepID=UPI000BD6A164|nr:hypothetical protein [Rhodobacter sp. JA431]SOB99754.1 hypothetical protein SAMN05877809_102498 [Rhodobacter sp. JA431]